MRGLIIDTTFKSAYAAAFDGEKESVALFDPSCSTQSALISACRQALGALGISPSDLDGIAAVVGPGSFTGIRIGVTFVNAMAYALSLPRYSFTTFDVMQVIKPNASAYWVDAGHGSAYAAFAREGFLEQKNVDQTLLPSGAVEQGELASDLPKGALLSIRKAMEERAYSACAPTHEREYLKPNYMRRSQAERLKEPDHDE